MYSKLRRIAPVAVVAALSAGLAACDIAVDGHGGLGIELASGRAQDQWTRSYKVSDGGRLEIININGRITAEPAAGGTVEILTDRTVKSLSDDQAREILGQIEMREEVGDARVRVEVRAPRFRGASNHEIKWTIKVPKGVSVDLRTVNGGVHLNGLQGDVRARSTNGGIVGSELIASNVEASVTNGGVEINLARAPSNGSIDLESVNGGVSLSLPPDSKADITARCVNGGISINGLELEITGEQTKRRLAGKLNGGGTRVSMETVNGGVKIGRSEGRTVTTDR
jgi:Putative adhesin